MKDAYRTKPILTVQQLHDILTKAISEGMAHAPVYFESEGACFDCSWIGITSATGDPKESACEYGFDNGVFILDWDMTYEPFHFEGQPR